MSKHLTRREFLKKSATVIAVGAVAPPWLAKIVRADTLRVAQGGKMPSDRTLVVCQLTGGNDGLNTVIPYTQKRYYEMRPVLAVKDGAGIPISEDLALHPALTGLKKVWDRKHLAILNGVGYPNPNRSHFRSMEIWQTASTDTDERYGWLGRYLDDVGSPKNPVLALALGVQKEQALNARNVSVPTFASLADIQAMIGDTDAEAALRAIQGMDASEGSAMRDVQAATKSALNAMAELNRNLSKYEPVGSYGQDAFGRGFRQIAHLIAVSPGTRVIYFSVGGFDTHSAQAAQHEKLLRQFGDALDAFLLEIVHMGKADKVAVLVFSEFGRRVQENASAGTDHGAAGPMFVAGGAVKAGLHGTYPSLDDLDRGDLKHSVDFRRVYASVLSQWLAADAGSLLGKDYQPLELF
ncbi:MAG: DUF1501 domain-containing protein [Fimbriimonadia bacterium]|jgi:uncharacterized protein (DUF1501 family)